MVKAVQSHLYEVEKNYFLRYFYSATLQRTVYFLLCKICLTAFTDILNTNYMLYMDSGQFLFHPSLS